MPSGSSQQLTPEQLQALVDAVYKRLQEELRLERERQRRSQRLSSARKRGF